MIPSHDQESIESSPRLRGSFMRCLAWTAGACAVLSGMSVLGGADPTEALRITAVLFAQALLGMGIWVTARRGSISPLELIGVSLTLGPAVFTLTMLGTLALPWAPSLAGTCGILMGLAVMGLLLLARRARLGHLLQPVGRQQSWVLAAVAPVTLLLSRTLWVQTPLPRGIVGWASLGGDAAVEEARAKSIVLVGLRDYLLAQGHPLKYHLFAQAWSGFTDLASHAGTYVVTTRIVPLVTVAAVLLLTWTWITLLSGRTVAGWVAIGFLAVGGLGEVGTAIYVGSMSQSWGAALVALFAFALLLSFRGQLRGRPVVLSVLAGAMVLAKVNTAILLAAALGGSLTITGGWRRRRRAIVVVLLAFAAAFIVIVGFEYGYGNGLYVSLTQTADYLRTAVPAGLPLSALTGALLAALVLLLPWSSVIVLAWSPGPERRQVLAFSGVLAGAAVVIAAFTGQWGQSQLYFPMTAGAVLVPMSAWGCTEAVHLLAPAARRGRLAGSLVLLALSSFWLALGPSSLVMRELGALALAMLAALLLAWTARKPLPSMARTLAVGFTAFLTASIFAASLLTWTNPFSSRWHVEPLTSESPNAISDHHIAAIEWLARANPEHELVASNWLCSDPVQTPPDCLDIQFPVAAVGGQRMLIEGFSYSAGPVPPEWARERLLLVQGFSTDPTPAAATSLYESGVRWIFIDRRRTSIESWEPYAQTAWGNTDAFVLRLRDPGGTP